MIELHLLGGAGLHAADGRTVQSVLAQPKRFALLAYLALSRTPQRRDRIAGIFWPELDDERARAALRKGLYHLRRSLGAAALVNVGDEEVGTSGVVRCDVGEFERLVGAGEAPAALRLYRGELLPGFHLAGAPEFERWLDGERTRLRRLAETAAWRAAEAAEARGASQEAVAFARRALSLAGANDVALRRLLELHERLGDPAAAAQDFEAYRRALAADYGLDPSAESHALLASIRGRSAPDRATDPPPERVPADDAAPGAPTSVESGARDGSRRRMAAAFVGALLVLAVGWGWLGGRSWRDDVPGPTTLAVGTIHDLTGDAGGGATAVIQDLLATNLARSSAVRVVSTARLYEFLGRRGGEADSPAGIAEAARRAGATQLVEGALYRLPSGDLRLDLRRVSLADGAVADAETVRASSVFDVVDDATGRLLAGVGDVAGAGSVVDFASGSLRANALYRRGLEAYYRDGDEDSARALFQAALDEDSTFAMAAYYAGVAWWGDVERETAYFERADRLGRNAGRHQRLLVAAQLARLRNDPASLAITDSLVRGDPDDPDARLARGRALTKLGDFQAAVRDLERVVELDSAGLAAATPLCRACDALEALSLAYIGADSLARAERTAERWVAARPASSVALARLQYVLAAEGRTERVTGIRDRIQELSPDPGGYELDRAIGILRAGRFALADSILGVLERDGDPAWAREARWFRVISLRNQGRLVAALAAATALRRAQAVDTFVAPGPSVEALPQAIVLLEMGRARTAAALFDSVAVAAATNPIPGRAARQHAWAMVHVATALTEAGDTAALPRIADLVERLGKRSAYGRDRLLHHHVRGLLFAARGDDESAVAAFRAATYSPMLGFTRTNLELARALLRLGRAAEAIPPLRAALREPSLQAGNLYVTNTVLRETLAHAYEAAGRPDSAAAQYARVAGAWQRADPPFQSRRVDALRRARRLGGT